MSMLLLGAALCAPRGEVCADQAQLSEAAATKPEVALTGDPQVDFEKAADAGDSEIRIVPRLYPAISPLDVERWARWLTLSNAQRVFLWAMYENYRDAYVSTMRQHFGHVVSLSREVELALNQNGVFSAAYADTYALYVSEAQQINSACAASADEFLARVQSVLADSQIVGFSRVQRDMDRRRTTFLDRQHIPARPDLAQIVEDMQLDEESLSRADPVLVEYEKQLTPLVVRLEKSLDSRQSPRAYAYVAWHLDENGLPLDYSLPAHREQFERNRSRIDELLAPAAQVQADILRVNSSFLHRFAAALPEAKKSMFLDRYREWAYPYVYPDRQSPAAVYEEIRGSRLITAELREAMEGLWSDYLKRHNSISGRMEVECERYYLHLAGTESAAKADTFRPRMRQWRQDRWDLDERILKAIRNLLSPDVLVLFEGQMDFAESGIRATRQVADGDGFPM